MIDKQKAIALLGGNESLADKLIAAFTAEVADHIATLKSSSENGAWSDLSNQAHMIKTQAAYLGLDDLHEISRELEMATKADVEVEPVLRLVTRTIEMLQSIPD